MVCSSGTAFGHRGRAHGLVSGGVLVAAALAIGVGLFSAATSARAGKPSNPKQPTDAELYKRLNHLARAGGEEAKLFEQLRTQSGRVAWTGAKKSSFTGNLRRFDVKGSSTPLYLVRSSKAQIFILRLPDKKGALDKGASGAYAGLADKVGQKMTFEVETTTMVVGGVTYRVARLTSAPERLLLDRLFFIAIVLLLFLTMVGMGMTLTVKDFGMVFRKPTGMIIGIVCQFGLLPVIAMLIGRAVGYHESYPFIFLGLILVSSSPGGVTSNLVTYFGKGDVALSVALTAVCTVAALVCTPLLLSLYGANVPDFTIPVWAVFKQILVLVIVPLAVGMGVRAKWAGFAKRAEKIFAILGLFSLLFLIVVGVVANLDKFADTARYSPMFYAIVFVLTFLGMSVAGGLAKLLRVPNFQVRAIAIECGLRNSSLAMTVALLLQDRVGDFYSSMFFTAGIFGLWMYAAGTLSIYMFKFWLPVAPAETDAEADGAAPEASAP